MPSICDCPYCGQATAIPEDLDSDCVVRCPLCEYEYPGDQALLNAVEAPPEHIAELPPELIPIRPGLPAETVDSGSSEEHGASTAESHSLVPSGEVGSVDAFSVAVVASSESQTASDADFLDAVADRAATAEVVVQEYSVQAAGPVDVVTDAAQVAANASFVSAATVTSEMRDLSPSPARDAPATEPLACANASTSGADPSAAATTDTVSVLVESPAVGVEPDATLVQAPAATVETIAVSLEMAEPPDEIAAPSAEAVASLVSSELALAEASAESVAESPKDAEQAGAAAPSSEEHVPVLSSLGLRVPGELGTETPSLVRLQRRKRSPIRTAVGVVIAGLLALPAAYGLVAGFSKLGLVGTSKPATAESEQPTAESKPAKAQPKQAAPLPEPKSYDEWPDLDESRFSGAPKDVRSSKSGKTPKRSGDRKGP